MIQLVVARASTTGNLLRQELVNRGIEIGQPAEAIVSYGVPITSDLPCLNANASRLNKFEELQKIRDGGLPTPPFSAGGESLAFPILGRKFRHSRGRDIIPILQNDVEFTWRKQGGNCDFFVQYMARQTEFRIWAYRRRLLACYEKVMQYPERYTRIGCNWHNGFAFQHVPDSEVDPMLLDIGVRAVSAMDYDFGAVDILKSPNGMLYILEVNSAPGQENVRRGLSRLADKITRWVRLGYPRRADG